MINTIIQIILSIFLISIMAFIGYSVYNNEFLSNVVLTNTNRKITKVFTGILDYSKDIDIDFETYDKNDYSYLDINPSINQNGGAEYSYNFWIFFTFNGTSSNTIISNENDIHKTLLTTYKNSDGNSVKLESKYIILFYKGEKQSVLISNNNGYECNSKENVVEPTILVKNPLIKIRNDAKEIVVEFNNINYPETYNANNNIKIDCNNTDDLNYKRNANKFGIKDIDVANYKDKFNMVTVVFKEQSKNDNLFNSNKSNCKVYFNGELKADKLANTNSMIDDEINSFKSRVMKSNLSRLHINPSDNQEISEITLSDRITKVPALQMADLTYYNYALNNTEVKQLYNSGFNKYNATFKEIKLINKDIIKGSNSDRYKINPI
jgi:hypothetical protein